MTKKLNIRLFGARCAVVPLKEEFEGILSLPQTASRKYDLGTVVAVGDGKQRQADNSVKTVPTCLAEGDNVLIQTSPTMVANNNAKIGDYDILHVLQSDIVGKISGKVVNEETFKVIGNWILVREHVTSQSKSVIFLPKTVKDYNVVKPRYIVAQVGDNVTGALMDGHAVKVGDEVLIERGRAQPIGVGKTQYLFVDARSVCGVVESDDELEPV